MHPYTRGIPVDDLETLPPLKSSPGYEVLDGDPEASIRFDVGSMDSPSRLGIWRCTPGTFRCIEKGDELRFMAR